MNLLNIFKSKNQIIQDLYKKHIKNYNRLLELEDEVNNSNYSDKAKEIKIIEINYIKMDVVESFDILRSQYSQNIDSDYELKLHRFKESNGIVIEVLHSGTKLTENCINVKRDTYIDESMYRIANRTKINQIRNSNLKHYIKKAIIKKEKQVIYKEQKEFLKTLGIIYEKNLEYQDFWVVMFLVFYKNNQIYIDSFKTFKRHEGLYRELCSKLGKDLIILKYKGYI